MSKSRHVLLLHRNLGINASVHPGRLPYDPKKGISEQAGAINVSITDSGAYRRRKGYEDLWNDWPCHSLYVGPDQRYCYFAADRASDTAIYVLARDLSHTGIRSGLAKGKRIYWATWPKDGKIFYSNGTQEGSGVIQETTSYVWPHNPATYNTRYSYDAFPGGVHLEYAHGRIFAGIGNAVFWSEPWRPDLWNLGFSFWQTDGPPRMIAGIDAGMVVSDDHKITLYYGKDPNNPEMVRVISYEPVIEGTHLKVPASSVPNMSGSYLLAFYTRKGLCGVAPDGTFLELTKERLNPIDCEHGCSVLNKNNLITFLSK